MLKDGFLRFCDNPEIACCKAEKELERLRNENAALRIQLAESQRRERAAVEDAVFASEDEATAAWNRRAQHMATVDTVEVVRCRDCVHFGECLVTENDYCSKGERKENY